MSKSSRSQAPKVEINKSDKAGEFEIKILAKSDSPKSVKDTIKIVVTTFLNFIS